MEEEEDDAVLLDVEEEDEEAAERSFVALRDMLRESDYSNDSRAFIVFPVTSCKN